MYHRAAFRRLDHLQFSNEFRAQRVSAVNYPLNLSFKIVAIAPQISVTDATGNLVLYVKQKAFKLKEAVTVFADAGQTQPLFTINADRVIDFSATYHMAATNGFQVGTIKRQGMRSIWRSHYELYDGGQPTMTIREENGWIKVADALVNSLPIVGMFTGYFLNPTYLVTRSNGQPLMRLSKEPAFWEGRFRIDALAAMEPVEESRVVLGLLMMILLERSRG